MTELMTPAPVLTEPPRHRPTGNLEVHLPANDPDRPCVDRIGAVSLAANGTLELVGSPLLEVAGDGWRGSLWLDWVPVWENAMLRIVLLAPFGERGAVLRIEPKAEQSIEIRGTVERLVVGRFSEEVLDATFAAAHDAWTGSYTLTARVGYSRLAVALRPDRPPEAIQWSPQFCLRFRAGGPLTLYLGVAAETDGARTTAMHLSRVGWEALYRRTAAKLGSLSARGPDDGLGPIYRRNLYFGYFYSQAEALEGGTVLLTSKSPHYYVSGAYWARDSLLWFFPMLLQVDIERARTVLETAFARYAAWPGEHAQYLSGPPLYPGFELDQAATYPLALARFAEAGGDRDLVAELRRPLGAVVSRVRAQRHAELALYRTFLSPTDDPVPHPYLAYDNALLSTALLRLAPHVDDAQLAAWARAECQAIRQALYRYGCMQGPFGPMFAFAFEPGGEQVAGDEPAGSLTLLAHLGFCVSDDPVFRATVRWALSACNPYHFDGAFPGEGSAHFPFPSGFSLANRLLLGETPWREEAVAVLRHAPLDGGLVPESYDRDTGQVRTGAALATLAAFVSYALSKDQLYARFGYVG